MRQWSMIVYRTVCFQLGVGGPLEWQSHLRIGKADLHIEQRLEPRIV